jgi:hypothetical protein
VIPGDAGVDGVVVPDEGELRVEPVVDAGDGVELAEGQVDAGAEVVDLGLDIGVEGAQRVHQAAVHQAGQEPAVGGSADVDDGLGAFLFDGVQHVIGDTREGVVPGDALPLALASLAGALQGVEDALGGVEELAPGGAFVAAHGVHVGDALLRGLVEAGLFLAPDHAVLDVDAERAVSGVAVDAMGAEGDLVPGPLLAPEVFPAAVGSPLLATLELEVLEVEAA